MWILTRVCNKDSRNAESLLVGEVESEFAIALMTEFAAEISPVFTKLSMLEINSWVFSGVSTCGATVMVCVTRVVAPRLS